MNVLYNVVDRMYIGRLPGTLPFTALGLAVPVTLLITAFANLFGTGGAPLCSIARGQGDIEEARRIEGNALTMLLITSAVLLVVGQIFCRPLLYLFGASDDTYPYAAVYLRIYLIGTPFSLLSTGMNGFITSQGFGRTGMLTVALGAVVNIILDPIFIFTLDMGVAGAAIATVIGQAASAAWAMWFLLGRRAILQLQRADLRPQLSRVKRIMGLGVTGFCMSATTGLVQIVANVKLQAYGGDLYVGVMTAINTVKEVLVMPIRGASDGAQPVIGFNYGAGQPGRVRAGIRFMTVLSVVYAVAVWLLTLAFPSQILTFFTGEGELVETGVPALRIFFCGFCFMSLQFAGQATFVALGKARYAITFSLLRKVVIIVPLILLLPEVGLGVNGVFWSEPISDVLGGSACFGTMLYTVARRLKAAEAPERLGEES